MQLPYRWNLRRLVPGFTLDLGCGIGRNLEHLQGNGVGVDHNATCVAEARHRGFRAFTPEEFSRSEYAQAGRFDSLLAAHVLEHMTHTDAIELLRRYLRYVRPGGKVILVTPQERGYASDATHVEFVDFDTLGRFAAELDLVMLRRASFPFPRRMGRIFTYNEFVVVAGVR